MRTPPPIRIAPSLLEADFGRLADQIALVEAAGAETLHLDVMDGHFVPNLSLGVPVVAGIARHTELPLDVHLMITDPGKYAPAFVDAGAASVTFHIEAAEQPRELIRQLRGLSVQVGVSLNPSTPAEDVLEIIEHVDVVLVMTVWPGFGGQRFMEECLSKIAVLAEQMSERQRLEVDGGINLETAPRAVVAGADTLVAGSAIFGTDDPGAAVQRLRRAALSARAQAEQRA
jgi:ribulose-phosphate 3-epimerase